MSCPCSFSIEACVSLSEANIVQVCKSDLQIYSEDGTNSKAASARGGKLN